MLTFAESATPEITGITPTLVYSGVTLTITGSKFSTNDADNIVFIGKSPSFTVL